MNTFLERQKREKKFHDRKASGKEKISSIYELNITNYVIRKLLGKLENSNGLKVLEVGCGNGWFTKKLIERGLEVHAYDISFEVIKRNIMLKKKHFQDRVRLYNMSAEDLGFRDNSFDIIVANAVLHHTDLQRALLEMHRVLKKDGNVYFIEPLGHNPLLNYYRKKTPHLRSPDETPLTFQDIDNCKTVFQTVRHEEYGFTVLITYILKYFIKDRKLLVRIIDFLHGIDEIFLEALPFMRKYCWLSLVTLRK